jgi:hypothetical protein
MKNNSVFRSKPSQAPKQPSRLLVIQGFCNTLPLQIWSGPNAGIATRQKSWLTRTRPISTKLL